MAGGSINLNSINFVLVILIFYTVILHTATLESSVDTTSIKHFLILSGNKIINVNRNTTKLTILLTLAHASFGSDVSILFIYMHIALHTEFVWPAT